MVKVCDRSEGFFVCTYSDVYFRCDDIYFYKITSLLGKNVLKCFKCVSFKSIVKVHNSTYFTYYSLPSWKKYIVEYSQSLNREKMYFFPLELEGRSKSSLFVTFGLKKVCRDLYI